MIQDALARLLDGQDLSRDEARQVMDTIMSGEATPGQIGGFLVALRLKGETADEIAGSAEAMRAHAIEVHPKREDLVDTAGTGGDGGRTFNISTAAALARRRGRRRGREARQPLGVVGLRIRRRARAARIPARPRARPDRGVDRRARLRLHVRADAPPGDEARRPGSTRARSADRLQRPRAVDEPGGRPRAGHGRLLARARSGDRRRARAARRATRLRRPRRGRNRRALTRRPEPRVRGRGRRRAAARDRPARARRRALRPGGAARAARRPRTP